MCKECSENGFTECVPQWGATKPSTACTFCAGKKKSCAAKQSWIAMVDMLKPFGGRMRVYIGSRLFFMRSSVPPQPPFKGWMIHLRKVRYKN